MIKGTTTSGFKFEISKESLDNFELLEVLGEAEKNVLHFPRAAKMLLGEGQYEALKNSVRNENGLVPAEAMTAEVVEIFQSQSETKNS